MIDFFTWLMIALAIYGIIDMVERAYKRWFRRESHVSYRIVFREKTNRYTLHECTIIRGRVHKAFKFPVQMDDFKSKEDAEWVIDEMHMALSKPVLKYEDLFPDDK